MVAIAILQEESNDSMVFTVTLFKNVSIQKPVIK